MGLRVPLSRLLRAVLTRIEAPAERRATDAARAVLENTAALMLVLDGQGRIVLFNPAAEQVLGWSGPEVVGRPFWDVFVLVADVPYARQGFTRQMQTGRSEIREGDAQARDGGTHRVRWHNSVLRDGRGRPEGMVCVGVDVTEQRRAEARLRELAETDPLTGLLNRTSLLRALDEQDDGLGVIYGDLDGFKPVNDTHGHAAGDRVLVEVADRLRSAVRDDDLLARLGGDEFVVLCPTRNGVTLDRLAARLREVVAAPVALDGVQVRVGLSVGVAVRQPGERPHDVLAAADAAMYVDKAARRPAGPGDGRALRSSPAPSR